MPNDRIHFEFLENYLASLSSDVKGANGSYSANLSALANGPTGSSPSANDAKLSSATGTDDAAMLTDGTIASCQFNVNINVPTSRAAVSSPVAGSNAVAVDIAPAITVADDAVVAIDGVSEQPVTFAGTTGTLKLGDAPVFKGKVSGLTGSDALDLADISYGANTTVIR